MSTPFLIGYAFLWATLMRALLVKVLSSTHACQFRHHRRGTGVTADKLVHAELVRQAQALNPP